MRFYLLNCRNFLICLADELDREGKCHLADNIDEDFEEFLELLENGKLDFTFLFHGQRDPHAPYNNRGTEVPICSITGPQ